MIVSEYTYEWQDKAIRYATKLGIRLDEPTKKRWMRMFKQASLGRKSNNLEKAYAYLVDYPKHLGNVERIKYFFYIYENGLKSYIS